MFSKAYFVFQFLGQSGEAKILTGDLLSIIRQQRHLGTRVLIATQEPTLSPDLIDLANATFVHRFLSPGWYKILEEHLAGASKHGSSGNGSLFNKIVSLRTGEALLFCPTGQLDIAKGSKKGEDTVTPLSNGHVKIKIRKRLTADGGRSIMATDVLTNSSTHAVVHDIPMHLVVPQPKSEKRHHVAKIATTKQQTEQTEQTDQTEKTGQQTKPQTDSVSGATSNGQAAPKPSPINSNASHPNPVPAGGQVDKKLNAKLKTAMRKRAREMFEGDWSSFENLTEGQIAQLCSDIDAAYELPPGTTGTIPYSKGKLLNRYLVSWTLFFGLYLEDGT